MDNSSVKQLVVLVFFLVATAVLIATFTMVRTSQQPSAQPAVVKTIGEQIREGTLPPPPISTSTINKLAQSHGFQTLIAYTDDGFQPSEVTVHAGDTVRFSNNSSRQLWVGGTPTNNIISPVDPATLCSSSALVSCSPTIAPQDFWEITFTKAQEWHYRNMLTGEVAGVVRVK